MIKFTAALLAGAMVATPAMAAPAASAAKPVTKPATTSTALPPVVAEAMRPIRQFLDGINAGNIDNALAAYAHGDITITDEFAPHVWMGPDAPHAWLDDYARDSAAKGLTEGHVRYGRPARGEVETDSAYLIVPTLYTFKLNGAPMAEEGQMTFVVNREATGWKIKGWTWSGVKPHTPK